MKINDVIQWQEEMRSLLPESVDREEVIRLLARAYDEMAESAEAMESGLSDILARIQRNGVRLVDLEAKLAKPTEEART